MFTGFVIMFLSTLSKYYCVCVCVGVIHLCIVYNSFRSARISYKLSSIHRALLLFACNLISVHTCLLLDSLALTL